MRKAALVYLIGLLLTACSADRLPFVYQIDVQQGNVITQEMVNQLQPGMTRRQVEFLLGAPVFTDTFRENRWDYIYTYAPGGGEPVRKRLTVHFQDDRVSDIEGNVAAAETG